MLQTDINQRKPILTDLKMLKNNEKMAFLEVLKVRGT